MKLDQIINMAIRMLMRQVMRGGMKAGMKAITRKRGGSDDGYADADPQGRATGQPPVSQASAKQARRAAKMARRVGRM